MSDEPVTFLDRIKKRLGFQVILFIGFVLIALLVLLIWWQPKTMDTTYGRRAGAGDASVNGTAVLSHMFESAGHRVFSWSRLSKKLDNVSTIVWFPDSFEPPSADAREFLEDWLRAEPNRTLVYVGRDYDAAADYWHTIQSVTPANEYREVMRREAKAMSDHTTRRASMTEEYARWYTVSNQDARQTQQDLTSDHDWLEGVDASKTNIVVQSSFAIPTKDDAKKRRKAVKGAGLNGIDEKVRDPVDYEVLLGAGGTPIITRVTDPSWGSSKIIVVANGSFLLNLPLVNHEHRKLAGKLVNACGEPSTVVFLETGAWGAMISSEGETSLNGLEIFTVWPINVVSLQFVAMGILACFLLWPIFGRPKVERREIVSDFGKHITALGSMFESTHDADFARNRVAHYFQLTNREHPQPAAADTATSATPAPQLPYDLPAPAVPANAATLADHAVGRAANEFQTSLDFSPNSIAQVDHVLNTLHAQGTRNSSIEQLAFCLGVYVGEVVRRHHDGVWHLPTESQIYARVSPYMVLDLRSIQVTGDQQQMILNPIGRAMMQSESGAVQSINLYYQQLVIHRERDSI